MRIGIRLSSYPFIHLAAALAVLALAIPPPVYAAEVTCQPDYDFTIEVDGDYPTDARFYRSDTRGRFFIDIPDLENGFLMDLKAKKLTAVSRDRITRGEESLTYQDGLPADAPEFAFSIDGPIIRFEAGKRKVRILRVLDRPALVGDRRHDRSNRQLHRRAHLRPLRRYRRGRGGQRKRRRDHRGLAADGRGRRALWR